MKGFGFPTSAINGGNAPYRADTSQKKNELINVLTRSEKLWNEEGKQEESSFVFIQAWFSFEKLLPY